MLAPDRSLGSLLEGLSRSTLSDALAKLIVSGLTLDSREVGEGSLFFAAAGSKADGRSFIRDAISRGAIAIVADEPVEADRPVLLVPETRLAFAAAASRFFGTPSRELTCVGVTGTNGKTSVSWILAHALEALGERSSLCGTLGLRIGQGDFTALANTTPDAGIVQRFLATALADGATSSVLEATSQGVVQRRTYGIHWDACVFTNLTRDHLDLHGSMESYADAKLRLFTEELASSEKRSRVAIVNLDDPQGERILEECARLEGVRGFGFSPSGRPADAFVVSHRGTMLESTLEVRFGNESQTIRTKLIGGYNVENVLAAASTLVALGHSPKEVAHALESVPAVPGRLEVLDGGAFQVVVDYAHTPDGLLQAVRSLRPLTKGRLLAVFGCGGDRDRGKRPLMGNVVAKLCDIGVATSDNPRTEKPESIIDDIVPGLRDDAREDFTWHREADRRKAILWALEQARSGDVVLVAGKGHEDYQEINAVRHPFSDQAVAREILSTLQEKA